MLFPFFLLIAFFASKGRQQKLKNIDIAVIIDDSVSVFEDDFLKEKEFIYRLYENIDPSTSNSRISVGKFSTESFMIVSFNDPQATDLDSARRVIECSTQTKGGTCIDRALSMASDQMFASNVTRESTKILIVITDGSCNCAGCSEIPSMASKIKQRGIDIITVGVGYGIDEQELKDLASGEKNFFPVKSFDDLLDILQNLFQSFGVLDKKQSPGTVSDSKNANNGIDQIVLNEKEFLKGESRYNSSGKDDGGCGSGNYPCMNPIIVNIETCPHSKIRRVTCKPGDSRCFQTVREFSILPDQALDDLCRCSELALDNKLNYFKIDDKGLCTIGMINVNGCGIRRNAVSHQLCTTSKFDTIYKALNK